MRGLQDKAAVQVLCDYLGYDEGRHYFNLLHKKELNGEHSHSKTYRIFQSLYKAGAIIKLKNLKENKETITYAPLPPTFLYGKVNGDFNGLISDLEEVYLNNYRRLFENNYFEISASHNTRIDLFLIKHMMEKYSLLILGSGEDIPFFKKYLKLEKFRKIKCLCRDDYINKPCEGLKAIPGHLIGNRRLIIVDGKIVLEMLKLPNSRSSLDSEINRYVGYLLSGRLDVESYGGNYDYIKRLEEEFHDLS
jgi:hypothetical protein